MPNANPTTPLTRDDRNDVVIKCSGVTKTFKDFWLRPRVKAVQDVDLEVRRGEVFGLLGPNGSGKSTTIKLILGLLNPTSGRIAVFGKRPEDVATKELIGYLPEESYLYRFLNARETLDYYGRLFHLPRHVRQKRIDELLEMVGLDAAQHRPVGEYSKGMQRRIGLAQALINQPQLLILDEPTSGMDPIGSRQIKDLLVYLKGRGITILLCSHLLADVEDVCDRVTIMFGGRVVEEGTIDDLLVQRDSTVLESAQLDDETIQQIEAVMARRGKHIERVTSRRQTLEKKFLDLVERERAKGSATSGAKSGGEIAGFLRDEDARGPRDEAESVLDELTKPAAPLAMPGTPGRAAPPLPVREEPSVDSQVLAELSGMKPVKAEATVTAVEPEADMSVLAGLVAPSPAPMKEKAKEKAIAPNVTPAPQPEAKVQAKVVAPLDAPPAAPNVTPIAAPAPKPEDVAAPAPQVKPEPAKPQAAAPAPPKTPEPPPKPLVSKESGESGLGLMQGMSADDEELNIPSIDPPKQQPRPPATTGTPGKSSEQPDQSFLKALEDADDEK